MAAQHPTIRALRRRLGCETPPGFQGPESTRQSPSSHLVDGWEGVEETRHHLTALLAAQAQLSEQFAHFPVQQAIRQFHQCVRVL